MPMHNPDLWQWSNHKPQQPFHTAPACGKLSPHCTRHCLNMDPDPGIDDNTSCSVQSDEASHKNTPDRKVLKGSQVVFYAPGKDT